MEFIKEPERELPISESCYAAVCGGGIAGAAAALALARQGKKTLLIEREYALGGLATLGLVTIYLPICDGEGRQVCYGIAEELLRLSIKYGIEDKACSEWLEGGHSKEERLGRRFEVRFNPQLFAIALEELLVSEGVELLYGTSVCSAIKDGDRITHLAVENKSGRSAIAAKAFIDATGDADLCKLSGEDTEVFRQGNVPAAWYYHSIGGRYDLRTLGACDVPDAMKSADEIERAKSEARFAGLDASEITRLMLLSHKTMLDEFISKGADTKTHAFATMPTIPQLRMTRRLSGAYTMDDSEIGKSFADSVGLFPDWRKKGPVYELPYRCLYGNKVKNLSACGRCISVTDAMWDITRVIPVCAVSGEAAGVATSISPVCGDVDTALLRETLRRGGARLSIGEL